MADTHKSNPIKPVLAGAALGAAVAAGAVIMSDQKKRKQMLDTVHTMKNKTNHIIQQAKIKAKQFQDSTEDLREDAEDTVEDIHKAKKKLLV